MNVLAEKKTVSNLLHSAFRQDTTFIHRFFMNSEFANVANYLKTMLLIEIPRKKQNIFSRNQLFILFLNNPLSF